MLPSNPGKFLTWYLIAERLYIDIQEDNIIDKKEDSEKTLDYIMDFLEHLWYNLSEEEMDYLRSRGWADPNPARLEYSKPDNYAELWGYKLYQERPIYRGEESHE